jgi:hypothetical protein
VTIGFGWKLPILVTAQFAFNAIRCRGGKPDLFVGFQLFLRETQHGLAYKAHLPREARAGIAYE